MNIEEAIQQLTALTENAHRIFLVRSRHSYFQNGSERLFTSAVGQREVTVYADFSPNPKKEEADTGVSLLRKADADVIIAIGGGSVIDMAKLIRHYAGLEEIPLIAIPTTAGTGAEATPFAVCYINGQKHSVGATEMLPNDVLLLPQLTAHNPPYLTACTGFDALAQAIEAFWNINATPASDRDALQAVRLIFGNLPAVVAEESHSLQLREALLTGSHLAGRAIAVTRTTVPHALSYTMTSHYGYPHGHAVALTFPFFFNYYLNASREDYQGRDFEKYRQKCALLLDAMGWRADNLEYKFQEYLRKIGLCYDSKRPIQDDVVANGINMERAKNSPCKLTPELIRRAVISIHNI
jgi:alcohol dehydrogenase class IV